VCAINKRHGAHDGYSAGVDGIGPREHVNFVEGLVVGIRRVDGRAARSRHRHSSRAVSFLLIEEEVTDASNDTSVVLSLDGSGRRYSRKERIR
jgi:hypothetical protein